MSRILTIFRKEFRSFFASPVAYIFIISFLVVTNWLFFRTFFIVGQASLRNFFGLLPWIFLFLAPVVTMRAWAEEKKLGTIEVLMTLPVRTHEVVAGKFLACVAFLVIALVLTGTLPLTVMVLGNPDPGPLWGGYLGACLLGAAYIAIGLFASGITENQIVSFIVAIVICFAFLIVGENIVLYSVPSALGSVFAYLGLGSHFQSIGRGVIDTRDIVYYLSMIVFFLILNYLTIESRRWK